MDTQKASSAVIKKCKRKNKAKATTSEPKNIKLDEKSPTSVTEHEPGDIPDRPPKRGSTPEKQLIEEMSVKYPILKDKELVDKFLKVPFTNNQKGRIRQAIRESLQGTDNAMVPDIIHSKIMGMIRTNPELTPSVLRRVRILYNFLKTSIINANAAKATKSEKPKKKKKADAKIKGDDPSTDNVEIKTKDAKQKNVDAETNVGVKKESKSKVKGPKRYVVFVGNLPLAIDEEKIMNHFSEMNEHIKSIRIPNPAEGKMTAIAFLELANEASFEFALSKHHSMLGTRRINVLYTTQKNGKVSQAEAKSKTAKLIALQKSGKLVGSTPLAKKRSQRRLKKKALMKQAKVE